ncbi:MAG: hypothetical protein KDK91_07905, partial [Gammaproteobacteria bacterium]|nr:hypothetical protein [Gammaproteobacteria bacterium]
MPREAVFNRLRHRPLRPRVPRAERFSALLVLAALTLVVLWVLGRGDDYDPEVRDLPLAVLEQRGPPITLYTPPLLRWQDPALGGPASDLATRVSDAATHGLFPAAVFESPWQLDGRVRRFQADNLYEKINGEAEKFLKRGFVAMDYAVLRGPDDAGTIAIELFDQGDFGGSSGVFESHVGSGRRPALRDQVSYVLTGIGVIGRVGQYFFRAAGDRENSAIKAKAEQLVTAFASLGGASPPASASLSTRPAPPGGTAVTPTQTPPVTPPV